MIPALVILSGGQDSTTCLFWAKRNFGFVRAVTFNYGQRHAIEIEAAQTIASMAGVTSHDIIPIPSRMLRSESPLTSDSELETYVDAKQMAEIIGNRVEKTFVPMRNMMFLTVAVNLAVHYKINDVVMGVCQEDNANYPDCTEAFIAAAAAAFKLGLTEPRMSLHTPLMHRSKSQTIKLAMALPGCMEALAYSHTSYDGKYPPTHANHANILRASGFEEAGVPDPLVVRAWKEGLMPLPATSNYDGIRK